MLEFVNSRALERLGAARHLLPRSFPAHQNPPAGAAATIAERQCRRARQFARRLLAAYRADYAAYYERCKRPNSPAMRDPNAVVYLIPAVGMFTFAKDKATARIAGEFYVNAINVMRGASSVSNYVGLPEQEAFNIEYWLLEEAKLQRMPKPKSLAGRDRASHRRRRRHRRRNAARLMGEGACVVLADIDQEALDARIAAFGKRFGQRRRRRRRAGRDRRGERRRELRRGHARLRRHRHRRLQRRHRLGLAVRGHQLALWQKNMRVLATGYFLVAREAFRLLQRQQCGGAIVFVASKNGLAASAGASAYCAAKASEIHLARCLALEGAPHGIRVNTVNPDAVLRGSKIWAGEWRQQRAASNKVSEDELEEVYRQRSMLKLSVLPGGHRRGRLFLRQRSVGQIDRQHPQCRRRQRAGFHAVSRQIVGSTGMTGFSISEDLLQS